MESDGEFLTSLQIAAYSVCHLHLQRGDGALQFKMWPASRRWSYTTITEEEKK